MPGAASSTGLYIDFPSWFQPADTAATTIVVSHTELQRFEDDASAAGLGVRRKIGRRTFLDLGIMYPVIRKSGFFRHGFSDACLSAVARLHGDTLNVSGIFIRADLRIPIASGALYPFGFRSRDGGVYPSVGAGFELRKKLADLAIRGAATYTAAGQKETSGYPQNRDFLMVSALAEIPVGRKMSVSVGAFAVFFTGGGSRDSYLLSIRRELGSQLDLSLAGVVESGDRDDRLLDSLIKITFSFSPPGRLQTGSGDKGTGSGGKKPEAAPAPGEAGSRPGTDQPR